MEILKLTNDVAFKKIFYEDDVLIDLINSVRERQGPQRVVKITRNNTEMIRSRLEDELCVPDVICTSSDGSVFIVEMQMWHQAHFLNRAQYYSARVLVDQLKKGYKYDQIKPVVFISVCDFLVFPDLGSISSHRMMDTEKNLNKMNLMEFIFLQLPKFDQEDLNTTMSRREMWLYFFKYEGEFPSAKMSWIKDKFPLVAKAVDTLKKVNFTDNEMVEYNKLEDITRQEDGRISFAKAEGAKEVAKKMLDKGIPIEIICECSGLKSEDFVES